MDAMNLLNSPETFKEFVTYCYTRILGRNPGPEDTGYWTSLLEHGISKQEILLRFLNSDEYTERQNFLSSPTVKFAPPGHFYSPLPDLREVKKIYREKAIPRELPGIEINKDEQIALLKKFQRDISMVPFGNECRRDTRYYFNNGWFGYCDGTILYCMIKLFRPARFIEVGSGFSSLVTLDTCELLNLDTKITFIEPFPDRLLSVLPDIDNPEKYLIREMLQTVDISLFSGLNSGDILFFDCSHVVKFGSDVHYILTEILPRIKPGVIIHFHDIFWPFEYPLEWLEEGRAWNEAYFLRAFLTDNKNYEILYFNDYMGKMHRDLISQYMPRASDNSGGSLWLKKVR